MADDSLTDDLSDELKRKLDEAAGLISPIKDPEEREIILVAACEYLENAVDRALGITSSPGKKMVRIWLNQAKTPDAANNSKASKNVGVGGGMNVPLTDEEKNLFPQVEGGIDQWALVHIDVQNPTTWCYYTSGGKKCFTSG